MPLEAALTTLNTQTWLRGLGGSGFGVFQGQGRFGLEFKAMGRAEAKAIRSSSPRARKAKILEPEMFGTFWEVQRKDLQHHSAKKGVPNTTGVLHQGLGFLEGLLQGFSA